MRKRSKFAVLLTFSKGAFAKAVYVRFEEEKKNQVRRNRHITV
jgi:hypothetical protein